MEKLSERVLRQFKACRTEGPEHQTTPNGQFSALEKKFRGSKRDQTRIEIGAQLRRQRCEKSLRRRGVLKRQKRRDSTTTTQCG